MTEKPDRLSHLIDLSRLALGWEGVWRAFIWILTLSALFLAASWFGFWERAPAFARPIGLAGFCGLAAYGVWRAFAWPTRAAAIARLDCDPAHPGLASSIVDRLELGSSDPTARALWRIHQGRLDRALRALKPKLPSPDLARFDGRALRWAALVLALVAAVYAGDERARRFAIAFDWSGAGASAAGRRIDIWIDPPAYTGRAPIMLTEGAVETQNTVAAPINSRILAKMSPPGSGRLAISGAIAPKPVDAAAESIARPRADDRNSAAKAGAGGDKIDEYALNGDGAISWSGTRGKRSLAISAIPDQPPRVELLEQPRAQARGAMILEYRLSDDYGVTRADLAFDQPEATDGQPASKPLFEAPEAQLQLGPESGGLGEARSSVDLSDHPWAGARVRLKLIARDAGGGIGESAPISIYLPMRTFNNPLARAVLEQRRILALKPEQRQFVLFALEALLSDPEASHMKAGEFLGLRALFRQIGNTADLAALRTAVADMWTFALMIEGGDSTDQERALRAAAEALRQALKEGASPEEIARRMADLRQALDDFLQAMGERPGNSGEQAQNPNPGAQTITPNQLREMLNSMSESAQRGDHAQAQAMLDQLQDVLENLREGAAAPSGAQSRDLRRKLEDLNKLTREQQRLRDESYADSDPSKPRGSRGDDKHDGASGQPGLEQRQQALRQALDRLRGRPQEESQSEEGQGEGGPLGAASEAMKEAERNLRPGGQRRRGVDAQGRALENLRKGAQQLAQQLDQLENGAGAMGRAERDEGEDPLGRKQGRRANVRSPYPPEASSPSQRAQKVLEELRRRLSDPARPQDELDYLERLIRRY